MISLDVVVLLAVCVAIIDEDAHTERSRGLLARVIMILKVDAVNISALCPSLSSDEATVTVLLCEDSSEERFVKETLPQTTYLWVIQEAEAKRL